MKRITYRNEYGQARLIECSEKCQNYTKCIADTGDRSIYSCNEYLINIVAKYEDMIDNGTLTENINKNKSTAYLIKHIEEYGKLMAYCIQNNIDVSQAPWEEYTSNRCCSYIDVNKCRCLCNTYEYYKSKGYKITEPAFYVNSGNNIIIS